MIKLLAYFGRFAIPAAMVVYITLEITKSQTVEGLWIYVVLVGASLTGVGIETVGILSGHSLDAYLRQRDYGRAALSFALLAGYTYAASHILWANEALRTIPIIAAVLYLVAPLAESAEAATKEALTFMSREQRQEQRDHAHAQRLEADQAAWQRDQDARDKQAKRLRLAQTQADKTAVALAKVQPLPPEHLPEPAPVNVQGKKRTKRSPKKVSKGDKRSLIVAELEVNPERSNAEIGRLVGSAGQHVGRVRNSLNGSANN